MALFGKKKNYVHIFNEDEAQTSEQIVDSNNDESETEQVVENVIPEIKKPMQFRQFSDDKNLEEEFKDYLNTESSEDKDDTYNVEEKTPLYNVDSFEGTGSFVENSPSEEETAKEDLPNVNGSLYEEPTSETLYDFPSSDENSSLVSISEEGNDNYSYEQPDSFEEESSLVSIGDEEGYTTDNEDSFEGNSAFVNLYEENDSNVSDDDFNTSDSFGDTSSLISLENEETSEEDVETSVLEEEVDASIFEEDYTNVNEEFVSEEVSNFELDTDKEEVSDFELDETKDELTLGEIFKEEFVPEETYVENVEFMQVPTIQIETEKEEFEELDGTEIEPPVETIEDVEETTETIFEEEIAEIGIYETSEYVITRNADFTCSLNKVKNPSKELVIPSDVDGYKVVSINSLDNKAIYNPRETKVTSLIIPEGITTIEKCSFYGCKDLENIELPNSLVFIGEYAFAYCLALKSIVIPENVEMLKNDCFKCCANLTFISVYNKECAILENVFDTNNKNTIIYGFADSTIDEYTKAFNKNFRELAINKISVNYTGSSLSINEEINCDDIVVSAIWTNKHKEELTDYTLSTTSFTDSGVHRVSISYVDERGKRFDTSFDVFVKGKILEDITATYLGEPVIRGTSLNKDNIQVFGLFDDDSMEELTDFILDTELIENIGDNTINVIYDSRFTELVIPGIRETVTDLSITFNREGFRLNDELSIEDFSVITYYSNGKESSNEEFTLSQTTFEEDGLNTLSITVEDFTKEVEINVLPYVKVSVSELLTKLFTSGSSNCVEIKANETIELDKIDISIQRKSDTEFVLTYEDEERHSVLITTNE